MSDVLLTRNDSADTRPAPEVEEISPVILCGGAGSRLWPLSTGTLPKQFLRLISDLPMVAETALRVAGDTGAPIRFGPLTLVGSQRHEDEFRAHLSGARLVLEPCGRNSAPAIAAAALLAAPDDLILALPADHHIGNLDAFHAAIADGAAAARAGALVTFGIVPDHPSTGYGYIEAAASSLPVRKALSFVEKPDLATAESYLAGGRHFWNAGIFLFRSRDMIAAFERHAPDILTSIRRALGPAAGRKRGRAASAVIRPDSAAFADCRAESIDFAVMEHADNIAVVPVEMDWTDIGDYQALHRHLSTPSATTVERGPVVSENARGCLLHTEGPRLAVKDVSDIAVIASREEVLVVPLASAGAIKPITERARALGPTASAAPASCDLAAGWLRKTLDFWLTAAWDKRGGGFVETLTMAGKPDRRAVRRTRVQARQIFTFAQAIGLGLVDRERARGLVEAGLEHFDSRLRHRDGGWVHSTDHTGKPVDQTRDLYDHAFIALAGTAALEVTGSPAAKALMDEAFAVIDARFADPANGGFVENLDQPAEFRRSNPHMHLLEASLEAHRVTGEAAHLERARAIVVLFEEAFFDPRSGALGEMFTQNWSPAGPRARMRIEPGHCYEWATLLGAFEEADGRDLVSWRRRLIDFADRHGRDAATGFALNAVAPDGSPIDASRRLWPQLEMLRARLCHPQTAAPGTADRLLAEIMQTYLSDGPAGGWMDEYGPDGTPVSRAVPASMPYHMVTAFAPLCRRALLEATSSAHA